MTAVTAIHRFPHDTRKHILSVECWCVPYEEKCVWVHNHSASVKKKPFTGWKHEV